METSPSHIERAQAELIACRNRATGWDSSCEKAAAGFALAMAESGIEAHEMQTRFRGLGLSRRGAAKIVSHALGIVRRREGEDLEGATPLCPHCLKPIGPLDNFCPHCLGPVTAIASIDPMGQVFSQGRAYQNAVSGKPRRVVVWGMWLIFGPSLVWLVFCLHLSLRAMGILGMNTRYFGPFVESDGLALDVLKLVLVCVSIAINVAILWKVTARWIRSRREASPD
jgi:hypothetical protein